MLDAYRSIMHIDSGNVRNESGTVNEQLNTILEGYNAVTDKGVLSITVGTTYQENIVLNLPIVLPCKTFFFRKEFLTVLIRLIGVQNLFC